MKIEVKMKCFCVINDRGASVSKDAHVIIEIGRPTVDTIKISGFDATPERLAVVLSNSEINYNFERQSRQDPDIAAKLNKDLALFLSDFVPSTLHEKFFNKLEYVLSMYSNAYIKFEEKPQEDPLPKFKEKLVKAVLESINTIE